MPDGSRLPPVDYGAQTRPVLTGWLLLAVGSLATAGALALLLAWARTPFAQDWLPWPWESFFRKALVTHVVFAFVVWYLAMLGALAVAVRPGTRPAGAGLVLAAAGAILMLAPALLDRGEPSLNNYVPVLIDPLFFIGLVLLATGVALPVLHLLIRPPKADSPLALGVATAGALYLLALVCFLLAWHGLPAVTPDRLYDERLFWGGGHLLQFAHTALLLSAWQTLCEHCFGRPALGRRVWSAVCGILLLAGLPGPLFYALYPVQSDELRQAFTMLYWVGLPLPPLVTGAALAVVLWRHPGQWRSPAFLGLALSFLLFFLGGLLGFGATGLDTRTPAHYHAEIGGVNLGLMALFYVVLLPAARIRPTERQVRWQFWLYGIGQGTFSVGMFIAGSAGIGRKVAGVEQGADSLVKIAGMLLTGVGGAIAVAGGVLFVWTALSRLLRRSRFDGDRQWSA